MTSLTSQPQLDFEQFYRNQNTTEKFIWLQPISTKHQSKISSSSLGSFLLVLISLTQRFSTHVHTLGPSRATAERCDGTIFLSAFISRKAF